MMDEVTKVLNRLTVAEAIAPLKDDNEFCEYVTANSYYWSHYTIDKAQTYLDQHTHLPLWKRVISTLRDALHDGDDVTNEHLHNLQTIINDENNILQSVNLAQDAMKYSIKSARMIFISKKCKANDTIYNQIGWQNYNKGSDEIWSIQSCTTKSIRNVFGFRQHKDTSPELSGMSTYNIR